MGDADEVGKLKAAAFAILLFGSRARDDHENASDVDILYVCDELEPRHVSAGKTSMFFYPWQKLLEDAAAGDLFVGHIAFEARAYSDPNDLLGQLRTAFKFKTSYKREIDRAVDLGWLIVRFPEHLKSSLRAKRLIWCVRTILIARLAEDRQLVFAPRKLGEFARSKAAKELLDERRRRRTDDKMLRNLSKFLVTETDAQRWHRTASLDEFVRRFRETSNDVALKTLEQNENYPNGIYA
jgi:hypothetical protein